MEDYTQFTMRISNDVYKHVQESAKRNKRSIAKEIEYILEQWCVPAEESDIYSPLSEEMQNVVISLLRIMKKEGKTNIDI